MVTASGDEHTSSLSFGFEEVDKDANFDKKKQIKLRNYSSERITFDISAVAPPGIAALGAAFADTGRACPDGAPPTST